MNYDPITLKPTEFHGGIAFLNIEVGAPNFPENPGYLRGVIWELISGEQVADFSELRCQAIRALKVTSP